MLESPMGIVDLPLIPRARLFVLASESEGTLACVGKMLRLEVPALRSVIDPLRSARNDAQRWKML